MPTKVKNRTVKQQAWIEAMLTGCIPTEAARIAKYKPDQCKFRGYENTTKSYLMDEIDRRKAELSAETGYTVEQAQKEYEEARELAMRINQPAAAAGAVTGKARLFGMDKDAGGKDTVTVVNVISYAGSAGVESPKQVESTVIEEDG